MSWLITRYRMFKNRKKIKSIDLLNKKYHSRISYSSNVDGVSFNGGYNIISANVSFSLLGKCSVVNGGNLSHCLIGSFCSIAAGVCYFYGNHPTNLISSSSCFYESIGAPPVRISNSNHPVELITCDNGYSVTIGNDVWIGQTVTIKPGITIGDGAVIGACSVVTKDVPPYAIVAGNPARIIRYRFTEEQIKALLEIKWWDWPLETIKERKDDFNDDIEGFIKKYGKQKEN